MSFRNWRALLVPSCVVGVLWTGCSADPVRLGDNADGGGIFAPSEDGGPDASPSLLMCIGTECPAPYATCLSPGKPAYKCGADLLHDEDNCGACGNVCLTYDLIHMKSRCIGGRCEAECVNTRDPVPTDWRDCNRVIDDGCEVDTQNSEQHCGACGNACPAGQSCNKGKCGCPPGQIECPFLRGTICVDPMTDDNNCGPAGSASACGNVCPAAPPGSCAPMPRGAKFGCVGGECGYIKCTPNTLDCNGDLATKGCASDGCEVGGLTNRDNCGTCGNKCTGETECLFLDGGDGPYCMLPCEKTGNTLCPDGRCADLLTDLDHCGACSNPCPDPGPNQVHACSKGVCAVECVKGFADCNADQSDGCETDLSIHPNHCGACGSECDVAIGQPCVEGKCLMTSCDQPGAR